MRLTQTEQWETTLEIIKKRIGPDRFTLWFKNLELVEFTSTRVVIGVSSAFVAEWLETKFKQDIAESVYEATGARVEVKFRVVSSLFAKQRAEALSEGASLIQKATTPEKISREECDVRPEFRLDNFVVGPCSQLAYAAAKEVCTATKPTYNPLFLHGPIGVGKTHLLQGIYNEVRATRPHLKVRYAFAERFTNHYVYALKHRRLDSFRHMYRNVDMLLIDDVQFFSNKLGFQEEFLHTFNAVVGQDHQVVMASDSHPRQLSKIHEGLASRFVSGMVVKLEPPSFSTRLAILQAKAAGFAQKIDKEVFEYIAHLCGGNVRDLEGALTTVMACASLANTRVDLQLAKRVLGHVGTGPRAPITLKHIESLVMQQFGVTREHLQARKRARSVSVPRQVCMYLARKWTPLSAQEIGEYFAGRNHTTVLFAEKKIQEAIASDPQLAYHIQQIESQLQSGHGK